MRKKNPDYEITPEGVVHVPTQARFIPALTEDGVHSWEDAKLGTPLAAAYDPVDVKKTMLMLWREYLLTSEGRTPLTSLG